jgi:hypothetical protein
MSTRYLLMMLALAPAVLSLPAMNKDFQGRLQATSSSDTIKSNHKDVSTSFAAAPNVVLATPSSSPPAPPAAQLVKLPRVSASMIHEHFGDVAGNCINDDLSNICNSNNGMTDPWLEIDLGGQYQVDYVTLYNRGGSCSSRLGHFEIWLGSSPGARTHLCTSSSVCNPATEAGCGDASCTWDVGTEGPFSLPCANEALQSRYVTILLPGASRVLNLRQVYAYTLPPPTVAPTPAPTSTPAPTPAPSWVLDSANQDCQPSSNWIGHRSPEDCKWWCGNAGYKYAIVKPDHNCKCAAANECVQRNSASNWNIYRLAPTMGDQLGRAGV